MSSTPDSMPSVADATPQQWQSRAHTLFERVADRYPERTALVCGADRLTFGQIESRANAIANALVRDGVRPGDRVGLALPRCPDLVIGAMGILKAGGAYVPLDPSHPAERTAGIIEDADPSAIITRDPLHDAWSDHRRLMDLRNLSDGDDARPEVLGSPGDIAYVLYTSGSTGVPKGVPIPHEGIARLVFGQRYAPFGLELAWLKVAPMGFDASTIEIYGAWLHGATLVMWDRESVDADGLAELCLREGVGACFMSFGLFSTMLQARPEMFEPMRVVTTGGEAVRPDVMRCAIERLPGVRFVNGYGPTEATAFTATCDIDAALIDAYADSAALPVGYPLRGLRCSILDEQGRPVGDGQPGELCVSGIGVTAGYLGRPELNATRFIDDPEQPGRRMYRTGDYVRRCGDGPIEFIGRIDAQVKVRGNRIELGEIDSVMARMPGVRSAAACVIGGDGRELIGLAVVPEGVPQDGECVIAFANERLPSYMVPSTVRFVDQIPSTQNGKVDRGSLSGAFDNAAADHQRSTPSEPLGATERAIASVWSDVLAVPVRSRDDTFVGLGGHSLKAMIAVARLRERHGFDISVPDMLGRTSLGEVAQLVAPDQSESAGPLPGGRLEETVGPYELSPAQERLWIIERLNPGSSAYTISMRLTTDVPIDADAFARACSRLIRRHAALRTRFLDSGGIPRREIIESQRIDADDLVIESLADEQSAELFVRRGFDLSRGPLIRFGIREMSGRAAVLVSMHHIISDGWSCEVIQRDLSAMYRAERAGVHVELPEVPEDPNRRWSAAGDDDLAWWYDRLHDAPFLSLPSRGGDRDARPDEGVRSSMVIRGDDLRRVRSLAARSGVTAFTVINAAFHAWLHRMTREEDLVIGLPVACRDQPGLEHAVGFFMATVPTRTAVRSGDRGLDVIDAVADAFEASDRRRAVPFQNIVDAIGGTHDPDQNPLFEVFFNYIALDLRGGSGDLRFDETEIDNGSAKFDLTCYVVETEDSIEILLNGRRAVANESALRGWSREIVRMVLGIASDPLRRIGSIPLTDGMVLAAPRIEPDLTGPMLADERVRDIAARYPDRVAARSGGRTMSYAELLRRMDNASARIRTQGLVTGDRAVVACEDPIDAAVSVLGVMAAGGCALIADPAWPGERMDAVVKQGDARVLITDAQDHIEGFGDSLSVVSPNDVAHRGEESVPIAGRSPGDPSYALFTSGTTGVPKGVVQSHAGLVTLIEAFADSVRLTHQDTIAMTSSMSFDSAIMDLFGAWFRGAEWRPVDLSDARSADISGATVVHAAPSVLRALGGGGDAVFPGVRAVVLGGEPAHSTDADCARRLFPDHSLLVNGMGMSESSLTVQWRGDPAGVADGPLPIGVPVAGNRVRLLDSDARPTDGYGEVEITSESLALGYLRDGSIEPIGEPLPERLRRFRTGDLARTLPDGTLEHAGRRDLQAKVMGVRVEPQDVRLAITAIAGVRDAVVRLVPETDQPGVDARLGAIVAVDPGGPGIDVLRARLSERLPRAMVPGVIHRVDAIPVRGNGKPDARAIDAALLEASRARPGKPLIDAREPNDTERTIAACFQAVLGMPVGLGDDFFRMGGNSLRALRVFAMLRERLGTDLPVVTMFRAPTPEQLAALIDSDPNASGERSLIALAGSPGDRPLYFAPGIGGNPHSFASLVETLGKSRYCEGYQLPGVLGLRDPLGSIEQLAEEFVSGIPVTSDDRAPDLIGYSFGGTIALQTAIQFQRQGKSAGALILIDSHHMLGLPKKSRAGRAIVHAGQIVTASGESRRAYIAQRIRRSRSDPERERGAQPEAVLKDVAALIETNRAALTAYRPPLRYEGDVLLFRARQPGWMRYHRDDGANGWRSCVSGTIRVVDVDVEHNRILHADATHLLLDEINAWLDRYPPAR